MRRLLLAVAAIGLAAMLSGCGSIAAGITAALTPSTAAPSPTVPPPSTSAPRLKLQITCTLGYAIGWLDFTEVMPTNLEDPGEYNPAVQVTATNDNAAMVYADGVNVDLYDASGDLIESLFVPLGVQGIAAGAAVSAAGTAPGDAVTCQPETWTPSS